MEDALLFSTPSDFAAPRQQDPSVVAAAEELKAEDNASEVCTDDEPGAEQDLMGFPSTQLLPENRRLEEAKEEQNEEKSASPVAVSSPFKPRASPVKVKKSPLKARSPMKVKARSPLKARSPAKVKSLPLKAQVTARAVKPLVMSSPVGKKRALEVEEEKKEENNEQDETPEEFREKGPAGKFTKVFPEVAKLVESGGWQIAQGMNTLFCAMPGVQFFNFKPNINVFDSKVKACWKFIQIAGDKKVDTEDEALWDMLWPIAEKQFGWFTMMCGTETWFVKPNTKFEHFKPNETVFQSKKRAVLKCLATEVGDIELGDSADGHQVIAFAPRKVKPPVVKKAKTALFKTPSPVVKSVKRATPPSAVTSSTPSQPTRPGSATRTSSASRLNPASSGAKRKLASSASKVASKKKVKGGKAGPKKTTKKKRGAVETPPTKNGDEFNFTPPEFKSTFGIVYGKLQEEGWYHRSGTFEYDYFSPTYTDATKELNVNYFRSKADLEEYLKVSGTWKRIEDELYEEYEAAVEEQRELALEKHFKQLESKKKSQANAAIKRLLEVSGSASASASASAPAPKPKKSVVKKAASKKPATAKQTLYEAEVKANEARMAKMPAVPFGAVQQKLIERGWFYRPGRFEYDYFKPSANPKYATSGEDRFESSQALEIYLKTSGLWEEIAEEITHEQLSKHDAAHHRNVDMNESPEPPAKRSKLASPPPSSSRSPKLSQSQSTSGVRREDVNAITNDIWANSHEFDFTD